MLYIKFVNLLDTGYLSKITVSTEARELLRTSKEITNLMEPITSWKAGSCQVVRIFAILLKI